MSWHQISTRLGIGLIRALRELMFMEATGLVPGISPLEPIRISDKSGTGTLSTRRSSHWNDHSTLWQDPATRRYLIVDEPYVDALALSEVERTAWCEQNGFRQMKSSWSGTYRPPRTAMTMFTSVSRGVDLDAIEKKLKMLPDDFSADD
jgi:hypothetical protein